MTGPIRPTSPVERRTGDRRDRDADRREGAPRAARDLVSLEPTQPQPETARPPKPDVPEAAPSTAFAAQVLGQTGQRRGLKGGPPVLDAARSTYLGAEYSGPKERRPPVGRRGDTEV